MMTMLPPLPLPLPLPPFLPHSTAASVAMSSASAAAATSSRLLRVAARRRGSYLPQIIVVVVVVVVFLAHDFLLVPQAVCLLRRASATQIEASEWLLLLLLEWRIMIRRTLLRARACVRACVLFEVRLRSRASARAVRDRAAAFVCFRR